jgi:peptidoglycan L-alanyl-D-glutamate endopeptidase CwlK
MDQTTLDKLNQLHPKLRSIAIACYNKAVQQTPIGVHPIIIETYRSFDESNHLYELGRTKVNPDGKKPSKPYGNIVSNAQAGTSWHNWGLAIDFGLMRNGKPVYENDPQWMTVVKIFEAAGFNSGLYFPEDIIDPDHLEHKMGQTINGLLAKYKAKDFIPGTTYVNF